MYSCLCAGQVACAARGNSFTPDAPAFQVEANPMADGVVIQVKGEARAECAGALLDGLLAPAACRLAVVTLDLSELRSIARLTSGVLAAYRRSVVRAGGRVCLAGVVQPAVKESLVRTDLIDLFEASADAGPVPQETRRRPPEHPWPTGG